MKYLELARIERCIDDAGQIFGKIFELQHMPKEESVIVTLLGERLYPEKFDVSGYPIFSKETCDLFNWKERSLRMIIGEEFCLKAEVTYEEKNIDFINREDIDTLHGLIEKIENDTWYLNNLIRLRYIYCKGTGEKLKEFVIFGKYFLTEQGKVLMLENGGKEFKAAPLVCKKKHFDERYDKEAERVVWVSDCEIPKEGESCPCCTRKFSADDLRNERFGRINGKIAHIKCIKQYEHERVIDKMMDNIVKITMDDIVEMTKKFANRKLKK